jgi:predicted  nucleic acid-binding Zn-ribbon protein
MEQIGIHKRDILIDRIEDAQEAQEDGQEQFKDALEQFKAVVNFDGGKLEDTYNRLNEEYEDSVSAAEKITDRINSVESVAEALFDEWESELLEYSNTNLRRDSERQLKATRLKYKRLITSMRDAEQTIDPVLSSLKDNVLYLKHNLNARAITSLKGELGNVNRDITRLIDAMQDAINESNAFIEQMR